MHKKINICYPFEGNNMGGSKISFIQFLDKLNKKKFNPIIILFQKGIFYEYLKEKKINFFYLNIPIKRSNIFILILRSLLLIKLIRKHKIDIIHSNDNLMHIIWAIPAKLSGAIFIKHFRNTDRSKIMTLFEIFTDKIIAISNYNFELVPSFFKNKTIKIYNPIKLLKLKKKKPLGKKRLIIGFVSNPIKLQKNPLILVEIAKVLLEKIDFIFLVIGSTNSDAFVLLKNKIKENNLNSYFKFIGRKFPIHSYLSSVDILISPAEHEALGRTIIEAMSIRIPVIASDEGGHKDIIINNFNGLLSPTHSVNSYVKNILKITKNKDLKKKIVSNAFLTAKNKFSVKLHVKEIENLYLALKIN